jgi:tetratricopeptide (TPR) repeat protein
MRNNFKSDRFGRILNNKVWLSLTAALFLQLLLSSGAFAQSRRLKEGSEIPEFKIADVDGNVFEYKHGSKKALVVAFLSADHKRSENAAEDILKIASKLKCKPEQVDFLIVVNKPEAREYLEIKTAEGSAIVPRVVLDSEIELWGLFGIIATPTTIIGGLDDKALCIKPGYAYDFAPVVQSHLNKALGIAQDVKPEDASKVKVVANNTSAAKVARYLQMVETLKAKEQFDTALVMANKALAIDPESIDTALVVGELCCLLGDSEAALKAVEGKTIDNRFKQAKLKMITGWAYRRAGDLESAEKHLFESVKLSPRLARAFFELGNVYKAAEKHEKAAQSYQTALSLLLVKER